MKKYLIAGITALFILANAAAIASPVVPVNPPFTDTIPSLYEKREYSYMGQTLPYRILFPEDYDSSKKYPLILFLHGAGERGNDNEKQLVHGSTLFTKEENRKNYPAFVVVPQCPADSFWARIKIDTSQKSFHLEFDYNEMATWPLMAANALVKQIAKKESVDTNRLYITGLSMGGMGTFETVYRLPGMYAAAMPICGGGSAKHYTKNVLPTAFWIFHGDADPVVNIKLSREMVAKLKKLKAKVKYTEYPGVGHNSWDNAFAEPDFLKWLFEQKLE